MTTNSNLGTEYQNSGGLNDARFDWYSTQSPSKSRNARFPFVAEPNAVVSVGADATWGLCRYVTDAQRAVVPGARVSVARRNHRIERRWEPPTKTGENIAGGLATGRYSFAGTERGFQDREFAKGWPFSPGAANGINLSLVVGKLSVRDGRGMLCPSATPTPPPSKE